MSVMSSLKRGLADFMPKVRGNSKQFGIKQATIDLGHNKMKAERKQRKKMVKFYTRQAKRNSILLQKGFNKVFV